jgi:hypothetical protein
MFKATASARFWTLSFALATVYTLKTATMKTTLVKVTMAVIGMN